MKGLACIAWYVAPVLLSGIAFRGAIDVAFHYDDYLHLYDIVNLGPGTFWLVNHGGHLQLTRNAAYIALHALFGTDARSIMAVVLCTHLLNVALLVAVARSLTGSLPIASLAAAWWGASPMNSEALGWFSVYGEVLSATAVLWVLRRITAGARGAPVGPFAPAGVTLALLAAATSFGTGLAMTLCMPAVACLILAETPARGRLVRAAGVAAVASLALYVVIDHINVELFGVQSAAAFVSPLRDYLGPAIAFFALLATNGAAIALAGPFFSPLNALGAWAAPLVCALALTLLVVPRPPARTVLACVLLSLAAYGMIALGRYLSGQSHLGDPTLWGRYHYAAPLGFGLALAASVAMALDRLRASDRARTLLVVAGYAMAVAGYAGFFPPLPRYLDVQREVDAALATVEAAVRASPPGADVYLRYKPFFTSDLTSLRAGKEIIPLPRRFPGVAALFAVYYPSNVLDGRRVFFVVDDPVKLESWQRGRRGASLLLSSAELRARGGSLLQ